MRLSNGRPYLAIPGPSVIPEAVLRAMHRSSPNIYEGELIEMTHGLIPDLKALAGTQHQATIYIGNGHAVWEASLSNVIAPGDRVLVPATGRFATGWAEVAEGLGAEVQLIDFGLRSPMDFDRITDTLRADSDHRIKAVLGVHVDTSTSIKTDMGQLRAALDAAGHPALLMADCIASLGCDPFHMDAMGVDVMIAASQKGVMVPPGLGFVFFNDKAANVRANMPRVSRYWDWVPRANPDLYYQFFAGTAPTHHLYGLRVALDMIAEEGLNNVFARHERLAQAIWAAVIAWGKGGPVELNVRDAVHRSNAVTALRIGAPHGTNLRRWTQDNAGVTLGIGLGMSTRDDPNGDGFFRFGHMGHVNAHMVLGLLSTVQAGMQACHIPFGPGALDAATKVISGP
ncbi:alanine-glyoxylate transaminase / serine-glyoxylate transaminase / serine-pyruvate transaminase [Shimia gijangensis]|uniref:Alanine-glyoxylate transaminase / serine-glyoxylate transaminase / serine-pyruvate transaminase n=1 Tax=Shimia gijangensis TaxID=1470563 RepID=A0A1M6H0S1_9RHOB|nr:aminotransferase class V-fold PLP-dependent enzyme [Shimia gijangensis]SHJ15809.1 alanine-glyoxylate transaminase / serine-glyoxylate transaminase / serine-pyruvate transaminase [Shimia gijangensis]